MANQTSDTISVGTEAWNIADGYVKLKVLKQLIICDKLEMVAIYGTEDIDEEGIVPPEMIPFKRVNAINRLKDNLKQLFGNVKFAIRKDDSDRFEQLRDRIEIVEEMLDAVSYISENHVTHNKELVVNEQWFAKMLTELQEIKESVNIPINNAGLIFRSSEEISFEDLLKDVAEGG